MKVDLPPSMTHDLALLCAKRVHASVVNMQLRLTSTTPAPEFYARELREIRGIVKSISAVGGCYSDRRIFIIYLRGAFKDLRSQNNTEPRWQHFIKKVRAAHPELITAECEAKLAAAA